MSATGLVLWPVVRIALLRIRSEEPPTAPVTTGAPHPEAYGAA